MKDDNINYPQLTAILQILTIILLLALLSCEPIQPPTINSVYVGSITYLLPSINQTTPARRTFTGDSVKWWDAPTTVGMIYQVDNGYLFSQIVIVGHSNCADSLTLTHSGSGCFTGDSLIESGSVVYYRRVGDYEIIEIGTFNAKFKKQ